jgi:hypothetical protein
MANDSSNDQKTNESSEGSSSEAGMGLFGETVKKIISVGLGAAFMTEESVRAYLGDIKLPKEVLNGLLQSAAKSKTDLMNRVGNEVVRMISKIDLVNEASRFVEEHKFRIQAEIEVIRKERTAEPGVNKEKVASSDAENI